MRHGKKFNHLGRKTAHRHAMLSNMANSLILHKRITTTVAKAKALRKYVEPILTKSKQNTVHSRRTVFSYLQDKKSIDELFQNISEKITNRNGGYTRIIKLNNTRLGDNAEMCIIELVDYNEFLLNAQSKKKSSDESGDTTRKSGKRSTRRRGKKAKTTQESTNEKVLPTSEPKGEEEENDQSLTDIKEEDTEIVIQNDKEEESIQDKSSVSDINIPPQETQNPDDDSKKSVENGNEGKSES